MFFGTHFWELGLLTRLGKARSSSHAEALPISFIDVWQCPQFPRLRAGDTARRSPQV